MFKYKKVTPEQKALWVINAKIYEMNIEKLEAISLSEAVG
jgi:hypothetical protein